MIEYSGHSFDSMEEVYFFQWCNELAGSGFISSIELQPEFILFGGSKELKPHVYHPDFKIKWNQAAEKYSWFGLAESSGESYIEIKPVILDDKKRKIDPSKREYISRLNTKWVFDKFGTYVEIVNPEKLFKKSFYPVMYAVSFRKKVGAGGKVLQDIIK